MIHTDKNFPLFLSQLYETNATLSYWTDFGKVKNKLSTLEIKLNTLNYLIGKSDLYTAVKQLWANDPTVFDALLILIACRKQDHKKVLSATMGVVPLASYLHSAESVMLFLRETGLADILRDQSVRNLADYAFGVEVGLDTNARKNRGGITMEQTIAQLIQEHGLRYEQQVSSKRWPTLISTLGVDEKRFDFAVYTPQTTYLIEVNFYSTGGSKLNEVARSYTEIAPKVNAVNGLEFVWVTDGKGWESAKNKLQEAYNAIPHVYNLTTFPAFLKSI